MVEFVISVKAHYLRGLGLFLAETEQNPKHSPTSLNPIGMKYNLDDFRR